MKNQELAEIFALVGDLFVSDKLASHEAIEFKPRLPSPSMPQGHSAKQIITRKLITIMFGPFHQVVFATIVGHDGYAFLGEGFSPVDMARSFRG